MKITENTFIDILGLPEWDDRVLEVLEALELERPVVEEGEVYAYLSSNKYGIDIIFDYDCITPLQKELEADANLYVSQITFIKDSSILFPFNIMYSDDFDNITTKIGREPDTPKERIIDGCGWAMGNTELPYWLYTGYTDATLTTLKKLFMRVQLAYKWD